jgi:putative FmdB family regulatory protein
VQNGGQGIKEPAMPIFEYACQDCGNAFELLVRSDTVLECPSCHSTQLDKQLSVFATGASPEAAMPMAAGPCGSCGHPDGPGACALH